MVTDVGAGVGDEVTRNVILWEFKHDCRSRGGQSLTFVDVLEADSRIPKEFYHPPWKTGKGRERQSLVFDRARPDDGDYNYVRSRQTR